MKKIITFVLSVMLLTACSETTYNKYMYIGESAHWEAEYTYNGTEISGEQNAQSTYSNEDYFRFILTYTGSLEELSSIRKLEYSYETSNGNGRGTEEFSESPSSRTFSASGGSEGGAKIGEDEVIKVHVKWDDLEETFELHNNSE